MSQKPTGQPPFDDSSSDNGIKPTDLLALPPDERKIMRIIMRYPSVNRTGVYALIEAMPPEEHLSRAAIDGALIDLVEKGWLQQRGDSYEVGAINRTFALNQAYDAPHTDPNPTRPNAKKDTAATQTGQTSDRHRRGLDRISNFWGKLGAKGEAELQEKSSNAARIRRNDATSDEEKPEGPLRNEAQKQGFVSSLFKEFTGGKAKTLEDIPPEQREVTLSQPATPPSGTSVRISKLFEELRAKPKNDDDDEKK
ncbi:MAG TPA: hypothetical protein PLD47_13790 [Aggregatilineales bacterium]|nr:hypothetical protein [Anaerolineales bacterium]HRE48793.1 hypothetical protein [Aggregatilineales bacterium]